MRLIDADALIETLETQDYSFAPNTLEEWTPQDMTNAEIFDINNAPTVDAVEVVRCKDCVFCKRFNDVYRLPKLDVLICRYCCDEDEVTENDYCSWGERKDEIN